MRSILDNTLQGFVTLNAKGEMNEECSQKIKQWFNNFKPQAPFWNLFEKSENRTPCFLEFACTRSPQRRGSWNRKTRREKCFEKKSNGKNSHSNSVTESTRI
jgi:hypothetical protein